MQIDACNQFCASLPHASHVVQWEGAQVWKVGGKVFAIGRWDGVDIGAITFKCSPMSLAMLKDAPGMRPAPYLASRGMTWLQWTSRETLDDDALQDYLRESHILASLNLPKRVQKELGLNQTGAGRAAPA
jgi:predicted DNA-binding protein (MmcQ/YjbR family)